MKKIWKICLVIFAMIVILLLGMKGYSSQWNTTGYSKLINVEVDDKHELRNIANDGEVEVYTYNLSECSVVKFISGKKHNLQDVIFKSVSLNDLTSVLTETITDDLDMYEAENYKIYIINNKVIITSIDISEQEINKVI